MNNPAHSIAVLNCGGNANRPELSRTVPYRAVPNRTVLCSGKAPYVSYWARAGSGVNSVSYWARAGSEVDSVSSWSLHWRAPGASFQSRLSVSGSSTGWWYVIPSRNSETRTFPSRELVRASATKAFTYGAFPLHGTVRFCTARYGTAQFGSVAFPPQFSTAIEWAGLFTRRYNCAASTAVTSS